MSWQQRDSWSTLRASKVYAQSIPSQSAVAPPILLMADESQRIIPCNCPGKCKFKSQERRQMTRFSSILTFSLLGIVLLATLSSRPVATQETQNAPKAFIDGTGPGWRTLSEKDFTNVNCKPDTWSWKDDFVSSTGLPICVTRTVGMFTNFELVAQWRHLRSAGNSGIFVWVPEEVLKDLQPGSLPESGIEVQVLDHGYSEQYEKKTGKKGDWFTTNGDVF